MLQDQIMDYFRCLFENSSRVPKISTTLIIFTRCQNNENSFGNKCFKYLENMAKIGREPVKIIDELLG